MLGDSSVLGAADAAGGSHDGGETSAAAEAAGGGAGSYSGDDERRGEEGYRNMGGNRWPRQETLALLKIRSEMDVAFRDATVKGRLWEEVSRKLSDLGYNRSAKKCKEKFENVFKYHKRTKEGRTGKPDGKSYRFFDQLEALENLPLMHPSSKPQAALQAIPLSVNTTMATTMASIPNTTSITTPATSDQVTVPSTTAIPMNISHGIVNTPMNLTFSSYPAPELLQQANPTNLQPVMAKNTTYTPPPQAKIPSSAFQGFSTDMLLNSTSSSTSSDEALEGRRKKKRKWKDFFERLMKEMIDKQEDLQKGFLEAIEKREHDRLVREEAWRSQEMAMINREHEILAHERSIAAAKHAAVMSILQKIADQHNLRPALDNIVNLSQSPPQRAAPVQQPQETHHVPPPPQPHSRQFLQKQTVVAPPPPPPPQQQLPPQPMTTNMMSNLELTKAGNSDQNVLPASSSRWPKVEIQALIQLRTNMDSKYQENGPKGPLWEEISAAMKKLGYNRNAKRCKEKWENINKYFKKVKDSSKKRSQDSKTCPYFHLLDALYKEKNVNVAMFDNSSKPESLMSTSTAPLMARPEQQWPPPPQPGITAHEQARSEDEDEEEKDGDTEDEEDGGGCNFEIVASKAACS